MLEINDRDFKKLTGYIHENYGINLTKKRTLIEGRLSNIILEKGFSSFGEYLDDVFRDKTGQEMVTLINRLTTNHTYFMREPAHFEYFKNTVLPELESCVKSRDLRIWSAGCSSGEEPYTLEMLMHDYFEQGDRPWDTKLLATDISERALGIARQGTYLTEAIEGIPPFWKLKYFDKIDTEHVQVKDLIRGDVIFRSFNLMEKEFPFRQKFQVIFCRNVMIYFDQPTKAGLIRRFYDSLVDGGYLFIGHSESVDREASGFHYIMPAVYRK